MAEQRVKRYKAVSGFPVLLERFLAALDQHIETVAQCGGLSVTVLTGRGSRIEVSDNGVHHPAIEATHATANHLLSEIVELNDRSTCQPGRISWRDLDVEDLNNRVAGHFQSLGFRVDGRVSYNGSFVGNSGDMKVSW